MRDKRRSTRLRLSLAMCVIALFGMGTRAVAQQETVIDRFNLKNGAYPFAGLIFDGAGNLYGTTSYGGHYNKGTAFELSPVAGGGWTETVLHSFSDDGTDGYQPLSGLIFDGEGNLYGTAGGGAYGSGVVFELTPNANGNWSEKVLHSFGNGTDGGSPASASLIVDVSGNLYGTTISGGASEGGTVFELTPSGGGVWTEAILHDFTNNGEDGFEPFAGLAFDTSGNLYGTTEGGGTGECAYGCGTVFELTPAGGGIWTETILHNFNADGTDGYYPYASPIFDASGNLYGTTYQGGDRIGGTVFELTPTEGGSWAETILHNFNPNDKKGYKPFAGLISDASGNLYGTTLYGGTAGGLPGLPTPPSYHDTGGGTVFELSLVGGSWTETVLFNCDGRDGAYPYSGVILDASGNLYGTTFGGGRLRDGTVFEITP